MSPQAKPSNTDRRLDRLEEAVSDLIIYVSDNQAGRLERSLKAPQSGARLAQFVQAVAAERSPPAA
ncbi:MAG: hypothetical protein ACLP50_32180 [Solirubrobacteraceae bacterium]